MGIVSHTAHETLRAIISASPLAIIAVDLDGLVQIWNPAAERIFGWSADEVIGAPLPYVPADKREEFCAYFTRELHGYQFRTGFDTYRLAKNGNLIDIRVSTAPIFAADDRLSGIMGILEDITERKQNERKILAYQEQLRSLTSELLLTEERERRRIALELHDDLGQSLALAMMRVGALRQSDHSPAQDDLLAEMHGLLTQSIQATRSLMNQLSPPLLYDVSLGAAIEWLAQHMCEQHGLTFRLEYPQQSFQIMEEVRILLFQAVRELFMNIIKHARARECLITITQEDASLRILIEDDGVGFHVEQLGAVPDGTHGFGLFSIRERLHHFGGAFAITSSPGQGTRAQLLAPLQQQNHDGSGGN